MSLGGQQVHKVLLLAPELLIAVLQHVVQFIEGVLRYSHQLLVLLCGSPL